MTIIVMNLYTVVDSLSSVSDTLWQVKELKAHFSLRQLWEASLSKRWLQMWKI